jgi:3-hydroxyisobutyrate dehydrogenase-like beta-hydroxyacid dehydrogenase
MELAAKGVEVVSATADLGRDCEVVLVYMYNDEQVRQVVFDGLLAAAMSAGSIVVVHTTGSPATAQAIAAHGCAVVDAPGSGGPIQAAAGALTLFVGGEAEHVDRCRPIFAAYATNVIHFGPVGTGQKVKLLNNLLFGAHVQLALEVARVAESLQIDVAEMAKAFGDSSGASYAVSVLAAMGAERLLAAAGPFVRKDVTIARQVAAEIGVPLGLFESVTEVLLDSGGQSPEGSRGASI